MSKRVTVVAGLIAAGTLTLASPQLMHFLGTWEGRENVAYADKLAGGLPTVCKGITKYTSPAEVVVGDYWSDERCEEVERLVTVRNQLNLADCLDIEIPQGVLDALTSHGHNFGVPATCASRAVGLINAGHIAAGCDALAHASGGKPVWSYVKAPDGTSKFVRGLYNRRLAERTMCLQALR